jgi:hypothetical protein
LLIQEKGADCTSGEPNLWLDSSVNLRASRKPRWSDSSPYVSPQQTTDKGVDVTEDNAAQGNAVWILMDAPEGGDLAHYAGPVQIDAEKLRQHFLSFTPAVSKALQGAKSVAPDYEITKICIQGKLTAEAGFALELAPIGYSLREGRLSQR